MARCELTNFLLTKMGHSDFFVPGDQYLLVQSHLSPRPQIRDVVEGLQIRIVANRIAY